MLRGTQVIGGLASADEMAGHGLRHHQVLLDLLRPLKELHLPISKWNLLLRRPLKLHHWLVVLIKLLHRLLKQLLRHLVHGCIRSANQIQVRFIVEMPILAPIRPWLKRPILNHI